MAIAPVATYRVQLTPDFGFDAVGDQLGRLERLGVSHVYLSPVAQAIPESAHGYDVVDHTAVRAEFGGEAAFERLLADVATRGMAVVIDHVPNHMSAARPELNRHWWALLRDGQGSPADRWFDVDWDVADGRVIVPILGAPLADVIADGHIRIDDDELVVYDAYRLPLSIGTPDGGLPGVLAAQQYALQQWREPARNVRRFFTIDDLVAVRVEHPEVVEVVDTIPVRYAGTPGFGGVRIDHIDGLADPFGYVAQLRERLGPDALIWVEKIVAADESLPCAWPVDGTTGYEFARACDQVMIAREARDLLDHRWAADADDDRPFHAWESAARAEVASSALAPDLARLGRVAANATGLSAADVSSEVMRLATGLPRYRTYLPDDDEAPSMISELSDGAVAAAILQPRDDTARELRTRWQQLTGPIVAKGAEDRAFYRYLRLASLCEVGGEPGRFGMSVDDFHREQGLRQAHWPAGLLVGSTHDSKRSEDVRARSAALTWRAALEPELVDRHWSATVEEWRARHGVDGAAASLAYQTAITTPGLDRARLEAYLVKACREAALHTAWEAPAVSYETALGELAAAASELAAGDPLRLDELAVGLSLGATVIRLTSPGVPDVYQGTEAMSYRLVDPDNRVAPDWDELDRLGRIDTTVATAWMDDHPATKTLVVGTLLDLRRRRNASFGPHGTYAPLGVGDGAIAYRRGDDVVVAVRRGAAPVEGTLEFPTGNWFDVLDPDGPLMSGSIDAASAVGSGDDGTMPFAVFERE